MANQQPYLSVVSPVFMAENLLQPLLSRLQQSLAAITEDYEIILVEDASPDCSWESIQRYSQADKRIKGIKLSRNFGQHYAIAAGLDKARGEWVVVMDCDLQDQPEEIVNLHKKALEGYDVVLAARENRQDNFLKKKISALFYFILNYLAGTNFNNKVANFGIYNQKVVRAICSMQESIRVFPLMVSWVGFKSTVLPVAHAERNSGKSSYNLRKRINLALDIVLSYSDKPLRLTVKLGLLISLTSFIFTAYIIIRALRGGYAVLGYASIFSSIWFLSGLIISVLGVLGLYTGKIFQIVKARPLYIADEYLNFSADNTPR